MSDSLEERLRSLVAERCGGKDFDAPGTGYSFSSVLAEERELEKENIPGKTGTALLKLSVADPVWKMDMLAVEAGICYYDACDDATRYTDNRGIGSDNGLGFQETNTEISEILTERHSALPKGFNSDWVQYSPGAIKRALSEYIPTAFFQKKDILFFPTPGYPVIKSRMNNRGITVHDVTMVLKDEGWRISLKDLPSYANTGNASYFIYFNNPHNPTGSAYSRKELTELVWLINKAQKYMNKRILLIVDEAYDRIRYDDSPSILDIPGWEECCIVLQSISKGWNATGLRFGYMVAYPILIKVLRKVTDVKDSGLYGKTIVEGLTCMRNPELAKETRDRYFELHKVLTQGLKDAGFESKMPSAGLCQFTKAPRAANGKEFKDLIECVQWFREELRISLMHYEVDGNWYLRWAVTIKSVPECNLPTEESVIKEAVRRLQSVNFTF